MNAALPTARELEVLPLRAIVAYSACAAQRLSPEVRRLIGDKLIDRLFGLVDEVCSSKVLADIDAAMIIRASGDLTEAMLRIETTIEQTLMARSLSLTAIIAALTVDAAQNPTRAGRWKERATRFAEQAVRRIELLEPDAAALATGAARRDLEVLVAACADHHDPVIGDPIDSFTQKRRGDIVEPSQDERRT